MAKRPPNAGASRFQTLSRSDPHYERDGISHVTFYSSALASRGDVSLFVPPQAVKQKNVPVVLLLHGAFGSHWDWFLQGGAHLTAARLIAARKIRPMIVVCPSDGLRDFSTGYVPQRGANFEDWVAEDVIDLVHELHPCAGPARTTFIAGLSMGGYGALRIGCKHATKFRAISGHSSATGAHPLFDRLAKDPATLSHNSKEDLDIVYWAERNRAILPPLRFDCGRSDFLFEENNALHKRLQKAKVPHSYKVFGGAHDWPYWSAHIEDTLLFFESVLAGKNG